MIVVKSNVPLSDNEMRQIQSAFNEHGNIDDALSNTFPHVKHKVEDGVIFLGSPPWDMTQELPI